MNSTRTAVSHAAVRAVRTTAVVLVAAGAVAGLVWAAGSSRDADAVMALDTSAALLTDADPLTDTGATGTPSVIGTDVRPLPHRLPRELRADLRELRSLKPEQRPGAAARIWRDALAGEYGPRVRVRAAEARARYQALPEQLRDDIEELRGLDGEDRRRERQEIREKALDGEYGDQVRRWAERRSEQW
ncbi:hypothetical protein [Streptomyces sp. NPDC098781]|uniref:hypothetical protein n=1 Tax=Streptomyces sp. NPDC098781 TaxID=3366097 RepID=UPI0037FE6E0F